MEEKPTYLDQVLKNRYLTHLLFWLGFLITTTVWASVSTGIYRINIFNNLAMLLPQMGFAYLLSYSLVPRWLLNKKYIIFSLLVFSGLYVFSILARLAVIYLAEPFFRSDFDQESLLEILQEPLYLIWVYFPSVGLISFIFLSLKMIKSRFEERHLLEVLEKEKLTNELKFLKAQIHPHFLFNTLNNLYALTLEKSDLAPIVVVKLSELLDYILYQCNEPSIEIHKEINLLQDYIALERLRYGNNLKLVFNHDVDNENEKIAPLLLLSFVENAFKHGASKDPIAPTINIDLKLKNGQLKFSVHNTTLSQEARSNIAPARKGIGSNNIQRQLDLNYPKNHSLIIEELESSYTIHLSINLDNNDN